MEILLAPVLASVAATCGASAVMLRTDPLSLLADDVDDGGDRHMRARSPLGRFAARLGSIGVLARIASAPRLDVRLRAAGEATPVAEVVGMRFMLATVCFLGCLLLAPFRVLAPFAALAGFAVPGLRLTRAARARRAGADRELPLLLDLLAAASSAGLSGQLALHRALEATQGPLAEELSAAMRRVDLGGRWRNELEATADRLDLPDLRRAIAILTRSDTIGSSLADALGELARESRDARRTLVAERARKAPVKMLFPLVFLVLPAFLLLTVVPVLVTTLGSIR
jgi:tight adherence protein C